MVRFVTCVLLSFGLLGVAPRADAGWVVQWENVRIKPGGERVSAGPTTMQIDLGRVRLEQPQIVTVIDYNRGRFTVINPEHRQFWSGTVDQYTAQVLDDRTKAVSRRRRSRRRLRQARRPAVDEKSLPPIVIQRTRQKEKLAGHTAVKYVIMTNKELFQELWVAQDLDLSRDLPPRKLLAYQRKLGAVRLGKSSDAFNALYRNKEYEEVLRKGFALKTITHHIAGGFERTATEIPRAAMDSSAFTAPKGYQRVDLKQVFGADERGNNAQSR